jgi:hypothetical protein
MFKKVTQSFVESIVSQESLDNVFAHLERLRNGNTPTDRTPLFKSDSPEVVLNRWVKILSANRSDFPNLISYDLTRVEKFGPQGGYPPLRERLDDLEGYILLPGEIKLSQEIRADIAIRTRESLFGPKCHSKRPLSIDAVAQRDIAEDKLNTNSGLPDFRRRNIAEVLTRAISYAKSGKWRELPAILGSRGQRGKDRFVYMFPFATNLIEKTFVIPIMDMIRANNCLPFSAWEGFDDVENGLHAQEAFLGDGCISTDFSTMDKTFGESAATLAYDIIAPVFQPQYRDNLYESILWSVRIPIMVSENEIIDTSHGMASGSGWTNLCESIVAAALHIRFVDLLIDRNPKLRCLGDQLLGDDGFLTFILEGLELEELAIVFSTVSEEFGLVANPDKQYLSGENGIYLQRFFDRTNRINGVVAGAYPTVLALNSAVNPERFHDASKWNGEMEILRWIMILENCKHHPNFHDLINFFIEGDKYRLGLDIPGFLKRGIVTRYQEAKSIKGFVPSYNQASIERGIHDFDTVKYLRSLA